MNHIFKRVVVILNEIENIDSLLKKAIDFSKKHKTSLEVLFVDEKPFFQLPDYFSSSNKSVDNKMSIVEIKREVDNRLKALGYLDAVSILVRIDDTFDQVLEYGKGSKEILFITAYHEALNVELLKKTPYSFWILKGNEDTYTDILLPIDLNSKSVDVIKLTQHIFPTNRISMLHDYHYSSNLSMTEDSHLKTTPVVSKIDVTMNKNLKEKQRQLFEEYKKEFNLGGEFIEEKKGLENDLVEYIETHHSDLVVMNHQDVDLFSSPSLMVKLLHRVPRDFLLFNI